MMGKIWAIAAGTMLALAACSARAQTPPTDTVYLTGLNPASAVGDTNTMWLCTTGGGCGVGVDLERATALQWATYFRSKFSATAPLAYDNTTGAFTIAGPSNLTTFTAGTIPMGAATSPFAASEMKDISSGGVTIGSPTGGQKGAGTLNATNLYINGSAVGTGTGNVTASGMTTNNIPYATSSTGIANSEIADTGGTGGVTIGSPTGGQKGSGTLNATNLYVNGVAVSSGMTVPIFVGTLAGGPTAYTMTTTVPTGFTATAYYMVCAQVNITNTGASTLNVSPTSAIAISKQTDAGLAALAGGELVANTEVCFQLNSAANVWVLQTTLAAGVTAPASSATVTQAEWSNQRLYVVTAASQTITLPLSSTLAANGGIIIQTQANPVTLTPNASDGINGGSVNTSVVIPPKTLTLVSLSAANNFTANLGTILPIPLTYPPGINPNNMPIANIPQARTIVGIRCTPEVAAGGTATITVVKAASGTSIAGGTVLHSGTCNANGTAATDQDLTVTNSTLAAGDRLGIKTTGTTIWTSSGIATGVVTVFVQ